MPDWALADLQPTFAVALAGVTVQIPLAWLLSALLLLVSLCQVCVSRTLPFGRPDARPPPAAAVAEEPPPAGAGVELGAGPRRRRQRDSVWYTVPGRGFGTHLEGPEVAAAGVYRSDCVRRYFLPGIDWGRTPQGSIVRHEALEDAVEHYGRVHRQAQQVTVRFR